MDLFIFAAEIKNLLIRDLKMIPLGMKFEYLILPPILLNRSVHHILDHLRLQGLDQKVQRLDAKQAHGIAALRRDIYNCCVHILKLFPYVIPYFDPICANQFNIQKQYIQFASLLQELTQSFARIPYTYLQLKVVTFSVLLK